MIPTLQTVLSEVKDSLVTTQENTEIQSYELKYPLPTSPTSPFNWNEFIESLSLTGLQNCDFFKNEIGSFNTDGSSKIVVDATKMAKYNQYNTIGRKSLRNNCN